MRLPSLFGPTAAGLLSLLLVLRVASIQAVDFTPVQPPNLDLSQLGRVGFAGNFDAISLYQYQGQNENAFSTNGSQSLLYQMPNGEFATLVSADASISTMCPFVLKDGTMEGVVVGGNFTSLDGKAVQGVALFNVTTGVITPLTGLSGRVNALLCDQTTSTVFVGGEFNGANSTNAIAWVGMTGWTNLPFAGFSGPVNSIAKAPDGHILFGGSFTGLGNTTLPAIKDSQIINIASAHISASSSIARNGFSDPSNIVCKEGGASGPGETWLLPDKSPGWWRADMRFGYQPTKLRVWNTNLDGRGTKTFRYTAFPLNGIMNLTFTDPKTNEMRSCSSECPLPESTSFQDFRFVNTVGMSSFQIDISDWYGSGAGLDGVELFQDDIYAYAVSSFDEPACAVSALRSTATTTGNWVVTPSGKSSSDYLTVNLAGPNVNSGSASVTFKPDIKQSGNYTVTLFTPGCQSDNSCQQRGISNVTGSLVSRAKSGRGIETQIFQTNDFDKYDQIYHGFVDANSDSFRPTVTVTPLDSQNNSIQLVAQRVRFVLDPSTGGLNGLFEWDPNLATVDTDFSKSAIDSAGASLNNEALIMSLAVVDNTTYIAGNFSSGTGNSFENIFAVTNGNVTALPNKGLNAAVLSSFVYEKLLFLGGNFTDTVKPSTPGLSNIAAFDTSKQTWQALGSGVDGPVSAIVPLQMNITTSQPETCITLNGKFNRVLASGSSPAFSVMDGFAIWVPSRKDWLQNLNVATTAISGQLSTATNVTGSPPLLAGSISSRGMSLSDAAELSSSGGLALNSLGLHIQPQQVASSSKHKRAIDGQNVTGAAVGLFDNNNGRNITVLGGHFTATATNGSTINNLVIVNSTSNGQESVTGIGSGLSSDSTFLALATQGDTLYAGGTVTGTLVGSNINGLVLWDLAQANYVSPQPPPFSGSSVAVHAIAVQPSTSNVYVAGQFDRAGALQCPSICLFESGQWSRPGIIGFGGSITSLTWQGNTQLLAGGNITIGNNHTTLATYDTTKQVWAEVDGAQAVPGPVTALSPANNDGSRYWIAGKSTNGSAFLMKYDGTSFQSVGDIFGKDTTIRGLSVLSLSQNHDDNSLVDAGLSLLLTGQLDLLQFGNASAALFNGTFFTPFLLSNSGNGPGSISQFFTQNKQTFSTSAGTLKVGFVVLIALACAAACIFLIVLAGLIMERRRRRKEGYRPAPQNYYEKTTNMSRIPPEHLFVSLGRNKGPRI